MTPIAKHKKPGIPLPRLIALLGAGLFLLAPCLAHENKLIMDESTEEEGNGINVMLGNPAVPLCGLEKARFVKVSLPGRNNQLGLAEVQVFTTIDGVETDVALASRGASATQSSDAGGDFGAANAIDGNTGGLDSITSTTEEQDPWWEVDLKESYQIERFIVWNRRDCCNEELSRAQVELLDAGKTLLATFELPLEPEHPGEGTKGPSFAYILPQSCTFFEGTYNVNQGSDSGARPWYAFRPNNCPSDGCPLAFWIDGTGEVDFREERQQQWMTELYNRGFVAVSVDYNSNFLDYGGCYERNDGVTDKAKDMFDRNDQGSVINQLCNRADVNCEKGIAVAGLSQGAQISSLAADYDDRVSAALLYGAGNNPRDTSGHMYCMDTLKLPKQRRRYFNGDTDGLFFDGSYRNPNYPRARQQLIEMSHYKCASTQAPDNCLQHEGPATVDDPYTGNTIDNTGGYYIIKDGAHGQFLEWSNFTADFDPSAQENVPVPFNRNDHLDWLAKTARIVKAPLAQEQIGVTLVIDLDHFALIRTRAPQGIFFEWAANVNNKGVLGRRWVVANNVVHDEMGFSHVPKDVIGFRLSARTVNAAFIDQLHVEMTGSPGQIFKNLQFERNRFDGFCLSTTQARDFGDRCIGGMSTICIDFCTDGRFYDCSKVITDPTIGANGQEGQAQLSEEFSKCPLSAQLEDEDTKAARNIE